MATDWSAGIPLYTQLANFLRDQIKNGQLAPGSPLPTESELAAKYAVSRTVVRHALLLLQQEGLLAYRRGAQTRVSPTPKHHRITLEQGDEAIARMPTVAEREELNIEFGVPVIEIRNGGTITDVLPASMVALHGGDS